MGCTGSISGELTRIDLIFQEHFTTYYVLHCTSLTPWAMHHCTSPHITVFILLQCIELKVKWKQSKHTCHIDFTIAHCDSSTRALAFHAWHFSPCVGFGVKPFNRAVTNLSIFSTWQWSKACFKNKKGLKESGKGQSFFHWYSNIHKIIYFLCLNLTKLLKILSFIKFAKLHKIQ